MAYASALLRNPAQTYREIDLAGRTSNADGAALVSLLYEELIQALRVAGWAAERNQFATKSERVTRATAILFALEANLDFDKGGEVSKTLARFYAGARAEVIRASIGHDGAPFRAVADNMAEIAAAWSQVRGV
ncbi:MULTISPECIES: flagellar protein FliS [Sphingomonas]|mgnify:CR=1 FL=1|uniref:Flagellar protein FliS n=1 Tax=Sphingomonas lycopersici TaxID=2951807 RepID=A0AA41ZCT7_9SPHN|nr:MULTISPECIES: flagellar protein FliS [Sphingomonas]MCW6531349.1 flagellar protein FliS [Sphingomonas lycopersici]MCW6536791.1 flagellar protein FliS [Sphingomonas lycopersici]OJU16095.1 MAG: flagellar export chaperone FliS [Sphingomonas sp. 66-10]